MSNEHVTGRRRFLGLLGAGFLGGPLAARFAAVDASFRSELSRVTAATTRSWASLRDEYMLDPGVVYLNHASIGTIPRIVHEARTSYLALCETNPWLYMWGGAWEEERERVRGLAAGVLGARAPEVAITHNTTEGFNVLAWGLPLGPGDEVLFSTLNHDGASIPFRNAAGARGYRVRTFDFPVERAPELTMDEVLEIHGDEISSATKLLVFPHVDNTIGLRHPLTELVALARDRGVEFVAADGAQSVGMIPVDLSRSGIDFYAASPHKWLQAPKGLGLFYVREPLLDVLRPVWATWGQSRWAGSARIFEDYGTRNLPEVIALGDALSFQASIPDSDRNVRYRSLFDSLRTRVAETPALRWRSPPTWELGASLVALEVRGKESVRLNEHLSREHGIVLRAFGGERLNTLRVSPHLSTPGEELDLFFGAVLAAP